MMPKVTWWGKRKHWGGEGRGARLECGGGKVEGTNGYESLKLWVFCVTNKRLKVLQISLF